jgi:prophage antirepressor-like protein
MADSQSSNPETTTSTVDDTEVIETFKLGKMILRVVKLEENGQLGFVGKDACDGLGYPEQEGAFRRLPAKHKVLKRIHTLGGRQRMVILTKPGLYRLILRSDKKEAEPFIDWVTEAVLPQIREKGYYARPGMLPSGFDPQHLAAQVTEAITALSVRFDERLARLEQGRTMFTALPSVSVPARTLRAELETLTDEVARRKRCLPGTIMIALYKEVRLRRQTDYRAIKKAAYKKTGRRYAVLDFVERDGNLPFVYNLALQHFETLIDHDLHPEPIADAHRCGGSARRRRQVRPGDYRMVGDRVASARSRPAPTARAQAEVEQLRPELDVLCTHLGRRSMVLLDRIVVLGAGQGERQALLTDSGRKGLRSR